jgi:hypothetical protein
MRARILFQYLVGNRLAILTLASSPWTLALGAMFVSSAALARDYDGEDLLHEPWHLLVPFIASLGASLFLFIVAWAGCPSGAGPGFLRMYLAFLGLFWMTAPLAWLYAVPYERFLSPLGAVQANLLTLGCVALWRVALMVRVLVVMFGYRIHHAIFIVMGVADAMLFVAIVASPFSLVISKMSGVRGSEADRLLHGVAGGLFLLGFCTGIVWLVGLINAVSTPRKGSPSAWPAGKAKPNWCFWSVAIAALVVWIPLLPGPQAEQRLRREVEQEFQEGDLKAALTIMSAHSPDDFPSHWQPPPRITNDYQHDKEEQLIAIWEILLTQQTPPWVRDAYLMKLREMLSDSRLHFREPSMYERLIKVLSELPEARELLVATGERVPDEFWSAVVTSPLKSDLSEHKELARKLAKRQDGEIRLFAAKVFVATEEISAVRKLVVEILDEGYERYRSERALPDLVMMLLKDGSKVSRQTALLVFKDEYFPWLGYSVRTSLVNRCAEAGIADGYLSYLRLLDTKGDLLGHIDQGWPIAEQFALEIVDYLASDDPEIVRIKTMYPVRADKVAPLKEWLKAKVKALEGQKAPH